MDTNDTTVAKLAKKYLDGQSVVADGMHDRLREAAEAYLAQR